MALGVTHRLLPVDGLPFPNLKEPDVIEGAVVGQNLLSPLHAEFHNAYEVRRTLVERSVFGKVVWRF
jgi:hypothetical protein